MYTHTFPDSWNWLLVTAGQYTFAAFDSNLYAGNAQTNFISYPLTQNGTQAYPNGGLGAYAQATAPDQQFIFAGGFQGTTNVSGDALSTRGFSTGKYAYFMAGEWAPNFLGGGSTVFSGTASHVCRESRATARECRSTRYRISIRNGGSFYGRTRRAEPRPRSKLRSRGVGSTTIPSAATTSTRWGSASFGTRPI